MVVGLGFIWAVLVMHSWHGGRAEVDVVCSALDLGMTYLPLAAGGQGDIDEATDIRQPLLCATLGGLLLLLLLNPVLNPTLARCLPSIITAAQSILSPHPPSPETRIDHDMISFVVGHSVAS